MPAYYNEFDPRAAACLEELIKAGLIAPGSVDTRSIEDVRPNDLHGFTQCHFFAGIGVWSYALRLAGWPDDRPVWTGSGPCQPFSAAGKGAGFVDERHLWPAFYHLIRVRRPFVVFGEQVASKGGLAWLDLVQSDLEGEGYAFGAVDTCAAGFGAPHVRQRLYWVADSGSAGLPLCECQDLRGERRREEGRAAQQCGGASGGMADARHKMPPRREPGLHLAPDGEGEATRHHAFGEDASGAPEPRPTDGYWRDVDWLLCRDGKWRPVEPGSFPLAHGAPARVGRLRGYGNAVVAQQAAAFVEAFMEVRA